MVSARSRRVRCCCRRPASACRNERPRLRAALPLLNGHAAARRGTAAQRAAARPPMVATTVAVAREDRIRRGAVVVQPRKDHSAGGGSRRPASSHQSTPSSAGARCGALHRNGPRDAALTAVRDANLGPDVVWRCSPSSHPDPLERVVTAAVPDSIRSRVYNGIAPAADRRARAQDAEPAKLLANGSGRQGPGGRRPRAMPTNLACARIDWCAKRLRADLAPDAQGQEISPGRVGFMTPGLRQLGERETGRSPGARARWRRRQARRARRREATRIGARASVRHA